MSENLIPKGIYKGCKADPKTVQTGRSEHKGTPELILQCIVPELGRELSVVLYFSTEQNALISMEMLRATGWKGTDLSDLSGIGEKEFAVGVAYEMYNGEEKMKTTILTGAGRIKSSNPIDLKSFAAAVNMIMGKKPGASGGPPPPPFG
jgi:hypothetical protein